MNTKPDITDDEIRQAMDFDSVLKMAAVRQGQIKSTRQKVSIVSSLLGVLILSTVVYWQWPVPSTYRLSAQQNLPAEKKQMPLSAVTTGSDALVLEKPVEYKTTVVEKQKNQEATPKTVPAPATPVYMEAEPVAGFPALYAYFNSELKYPAEAVKDSINGIVTVKFIIDEKGSPVQITILHSLGIACDKEAIRVIEHMPAWKPATMDGKAVASKISVPLTFGLKTFKP